MVPVPEAPLADLCREADPETVADFVGALFAARGYDVERVDDRLLRLDPGGRAIAVSPEATDPSPEADAVVAVGSRPVRAGEDTDVIDAGALREQLAYGLDRSVARDLLATHFGFEPEAGGADEPAATDTAGGAGDAGHGSPAWQRNRLAVALVAVAGVVLVGLAVGGVPAVPADDLAAQFDGSSVAETPAPTATGTPTPANGGQATATAATPAGTAQQSADAASERLARQRPPGIDGEGLANIDRLIATHRSHLSNTSYTMSVRYREFEDGRLTGVYTETIRVENDSRYSVSVSTEGGLQTSPRAVVGADAFSDEQRTRVRVQSTEPYVRSRLSTTRFLGQTARYLRWSLSVENSTLRDRRAVGNRTVYRVTTAGDPYQGVRNAGGTVYVTGDGLITYGRWTYTTIRPEVRVEFAVRTTKVGTTTVSRPGWVGASAGGSDSRGDASAGGGGD